MKKEKIEKYLKSSCLLTLANKSATCSKNSSGIPVSSTYSCDKILAGEVTEYQIKCYLHPLFTSLIRNLPELEADGSKINQEFESEFCNDYFYVF